LKLGSQGSGGLHPLGASFNFLVLLSSTGELIHNSPNQNDKGRTETLIHNPTSMK